MSWIYKKDFYHTIAGCIVLCIPCSVVVDSHLVIMCLLDFLLEPKLLAVLEGNNAGIVLDATATLVLESKAPYPWWFLGINGECWYWDSGYNASSLWACRWQTQAAQFPFHSDNSRPEVSYSMLIHYGIDKLISQAQGKKHHYNEGLFYRDK